MQSISVRLPEQLKVDLQNISSSEKKPMGELVREFLVRGAAIYKFRKLRKSVMPFAEAEGFLSDEDVFEAIS